MQVSSRYGFFTKDGHDGSRLTNRCKALIKLFKENETNFIIAASNASGLSAYHFIKRRMVLLSKELANLNLLHDYFGTHLDCDENTTNPDNELQYFQEVGNILPDIWSNAIIDGYPFSSSWVGLSENDNNFKEFAYNKLKSWLEERV